MNLTAAELHIEDIPVEQVKHTRNRGQADNPFDGAVRDSYERNVGKTVNIGYAGESTRKRSGEETGIDKNVAYATSLIRKAASGLNVGVKIVYVYHDDYCEIHFAAKNKRERRSRKDAA